MSETSPNSSEGHGRTLAGRLTAHVVASVTAAIALTTLIGLALLVREGRRDWERRTAEFAQDLAATIAESTARADHEAVATACGAFTLADVASHLRVIDAGGARIFEFGEDAGRLIEASTPILLRGALVGRLELGVSPRVYLGPVLTSLELSFATAVTAILALLASGLLIRRRLQRPLDRLVSLLDRLSLGSYPEEPPPGEYSEFRAIVRSFGRMAARVRFGEASLVEANRRLVVEVERREQVAGALRASEERTRLVLEDVVTAERAARESAAALEAIFDATPIGVALVVDRNLRRVNDRFCAITGYSPGELLDRGIRVLYPDEGEYRRVGKELYRSAREHGTGTVESVWRRKDGTIIDVRLQGNVLDPAVPAAGFTFTVTDITEQRLAAAEREALQERLGRSQKLEAIGTLAGGIAHDFNNILGAIIGYTDFCLRHEDLRPELREDLEVVRQAGRRAAELVRQILAFSRQASQERVAVQPRHIAAEALKLLRASFPSTIELRSRIDCDAVVLADPAQLHQILVNLCTNAALAMKERGGLLEVSLTETAFDEAEARLEGVEPHRFVRLTVRDTGCGMPREVQERIFEPFFTTRPEGQGTGMGLAVVHGIVKASGGFIAVRSAPGAGSIFEVHLPVADEASAAGTGEADAPPIGGEERVLLVDDEPLLVDVMQRGLSRVGYAVTPFLSSRDAIRAFEEAPDAWDVLVTDMTMPGVTGEELVRRVRELRPELPVILCTGYSEKVSADTAAVLGIDRFALKPVTLTDLRRLVREAIDERRSRPRRLRAVGAGG